ncbi:hypothetical protein BCR44DRAFT_1429896 [Catenaria anguillulae PL171]|uniref:Uncharacterized protein n=1 Tax=Catenaria anguillulae PL171 TaxID=765915 RepID=A0A1Y2HVM6_9FUNG|nr:hypothetical protein BCR44DRAFT_1429896 [Catenaria anguillulae PL171]
MQPDTAAAARPRRPATCPPAYRQPGRVDPQSADEPSTQHAEPTQSRLAQAQAPRPNTEPIVAQGR